MFWIATSVLLFIALLFVLIPLWLRRQVADFAATQDRRDANIALFHERRNELENELATGAIDQAQFDALVLELQQNLLADVGDEKPELAAEPSAGSQASWLSFSLMVPVVAVLLMPLAAYVLYQHWGHRDEVRWMDLYQQTMNAESGEQARDLVFALGEIVQSDDEQPWPRYFLAENLANIGLFEQAVRFYTEAADLMPETPEKAQVLGRLATARYIESDFELSEETRRLAEQALELNPNSFDALQLLATAAERQQDYEEAIRNWRRLIQINPNSQYAAMLRNNIAEAQRLLAPEPELQGEGPALLVEVSVADDLELPADLRVFVAARNAERAGMPPLAVADLTVGQLPTTVRLDDSAAVGPFNLSSATSVTVSALVSFAGIANPQTGDYRAQSPVIDYRELDEPLVLQIADPVP